MEELLFLALAVVFFGYIVFGCDDIWDWLIVILIGVMGHFSFDYLKQSFPRIEGLFFYQWLVLITGAYLIIYCFNTLKRKIVAKRILNKARKKKRAEEKARLDREAKMRSTAQDPNAPRGYNDRHPDDAKLWAMVDDPAASDGEAKNALNIILKRKARRKSEKESATK